MFGQEEMGKLVGKFAYEIADDSVIISPLSASTKENVSLTQKSDFHDFFFQ